MMRINNGLSICALAETLLFAETMGDIADGWKKMLRTLHRNSIRLNRTVPPMQPLLPSVGSVAPLLRCRLDSHWHADLLIKPQGSQVARG
jgi:hypothetical protein